jgi:hypothetical protein
MVAAGPLTTIAIIPTTAVAPGVAMIAAPLVPILDRNIGLRRRRAHVGAIAVGAATIAAPHAGARPHAAVGTLRLRLGRGRRTAPIAARRAIVARPQRRGDVVGPALRLRRSRAPTIAAIPPIATTSSITARAMIVARILLFRHRHGRHHGQHGGGQQRCP